MPDSLALQDRRDRAIPAICYYGSRRAELCALRHIDVHERRDVMHLQVQARAARSGMCCCTLRRPVGSPPILEADGRCDDEGPGFRSVRNPPIAVDH